MPRTLGVKQIMNKQYHTLPFTQEWLASFGEPSDPFHMLVYGHPKNGKTTFMMRFAKYLTRFGKVFYSSIEEGDSKTMQDAFKRERMDEIEDGKFMLGDQYFFNDLVEYLKGERRGKFVFIDSRDYMKLTAQQYIKLITLFPHKSFIIICWEQAGKPAGKFAKDIEYMVDIVVHVHDFKAKCRGRFGGNQDFVIWNKKPALGDQLKLHVA
jgi:predicted ATP-dependent serine protease